MMSQKGKGNSQTANSAQQLSAVERDLNQGSAEPLPNVSKDSNVKSKGRNQAKFAFDTEETKLSSMTGDVPRQTSDLEPELYLSDQTPELQASSSLASQLYSRDGNLSRQNQQTSQVTSEPESAQELPEELLLETTPESQSMAGVIQNSSSGDGQQQNKETVQTQNKDLIQLQVQHLMLFDKPKIKQPAEGDTSPLSGAGAPANPQQQRLRLIFEKDPKNTFLVTNPTAIFKFIRQDRFLNLSDDEQLQIVQRLDEILDKCPYNAHLLSEQIVTLNVSRSNQETIEYYRKRSYEPDDKALADGSKDSSTRSTLALTCSSQDLVFQLIHIGLRFCGKSSEMKTQIAETILKIIGKICQGRRFLRCHFELVYQFAKTQVNKIMAKVKAHGLLGPSSKSSSKSKKQASLQMEGYERIDYCTRMLQAIVTKSSEIGPQNYFFFSGYLSGILLNSKPLQIWPFVKGFSTCMWFKIHEHQASIQDPNNLPVLFNCASNDCGGFECYFNGNKLFYRILPPINYQPPTVESNGVQISEFTPDKWYFLGLEHNKPYLARAHLTAIVNDKQVVNFPMDYPRFDQNSKLNMVSICTNMVGQLTTFMLFREQISNPQKFVQMYKAYEYGLGAKETNLSYLNREIFDPSVMKKLMILYTPHRYQNKIVYDFIDMNDGELLFNCGTWHQQQKPLLADVGGINALLPLLDNIKTLIALESSRSFLRPLQQAPQTDDRSERSAALVNNFLDLALAAIGSQQVDTRSQELSSFLKLLLQNLSTLPTQNPMIAPVDCQTIQLLAELRFLINDAKLSEEFFLNLMYTSDFWMNMHNMELITEYWSFVKAIYSQDPVLYNSVFPIQNLIDFMIKICDSTKEGAFCCDYHKRTFFMLYSPWQQDIASQRSMSPTHSAPMLSNNQENNQPTQPKDLPIYNINKYLEPIAGVLEYVLTSGGTEVLNQIQYIAKSLTVKSCACFHIQMLKLLKVLLLDKSDNDCASPSEFASKFLDVNGLQILLFLCQNASFDVKAMCIKLIDVLSSHTQLIQMRIDTDLVTYLSHVILPEQLVQQQQNTQMLHHLQMQVVDDKAGETKAIDAPAKTDDEHSASIKQCQFFAFEEVTKSQGQASDDDDNSRDEIGFNLAKSSDEDPIGVSPQFNATIPAGLQIQKQISREAEVPIMQPPRINKRGKKNLFIESDNDQFIEREEPTQIQPVAVDPTNFSPPQKNMMDDYARQEELQDKSVSPMLKPTPGKNMFNFGSFIDSNKSPSPDKSLGKDPASPDNEAVTMQIGNKRNQSKLNVIPMTLDVDDELAPTFQSAQTTKPFEEKKKRPQMANLMIEGSEDEDEGDSDGQNSPELIIPKQSRAPRQQNGSRIGFSQPHPPSTRNKPALAFGGGGGPKGLGLNIQLSDDEDEFDKFMPPSREQFENQYGDTILDDFEEEDVDSDEGVRERTAAQQEKDEVAPKPTADVMMSRNLKGGVGKNFNFAFGSDNDDDDSQDAKDGNNSSDREQSQPSQKFGSKPINLLSQMGQAKAGNSSSNKGIKKGFIKPLITTDEDQFDHMFPKNQDKRKDMSEQKGDPLSEIDVEDMQLTMNPGDKTKKSNSFLQIEASERDEPSSIGQATKDATSTGGEPQGTTGATNDLNLDTPSCSSEQSSAKKTQKSHYTNRKQPNIKLAIDIVSINNQFNFGGEKGELKPEELENKLESDIIELAGKCVAAMRRAKKHKPKTRFNQLLLQEMGDDDDDEEQIDDDLIGDEEQEEQMEEDEDDDLDEGEGDESVGDKQNLLSTDEIKIEKHMQMALAEDTLKIRPVKELGLQIDNTSQDAENGDFGEQQIHNQTLKIDLNKEIVGDKLSYEELFNKNKKRGRSGRISMTNHLTGVGEVNVSDGNQTMTKSLRKSMFNEPMSVRGIKHIEIEEIEKLKQREGKDSLQLQDIDDESSQDQQTSTDQPKLAVKGIKQHKLTLTNIVEEEISPTSKSSTSILSKPKSGQVTQQIMINTGDPNQKFEDTQGMSTAGDKELLEEEALHSGSVELFLLNHSAGQQVAQEREQSSVKQIQKVHTVRDNMLFIDSEDKIDDYTQELENLYTSCLEWLLNRSPNSLFKTLIIDDYDKITFEPALHILMTLVSYSNNLVRQRALQDLHTLAQLDPQNGSIILATPKFHSWLLELMMPYQDFDTAQSVLSESSRAVYDMGCKLHTLLLKNACQNPEEVGFKRINLLSRWPAYINQRFFNKMGAEAGQFHHREFDTANRVTRVLLTQLINSFRDDPRHGGFLLSNPTNRNLIHITMQVEELILSSHQKTIESANSETMKNAVDVNESVFRWIQRDFLSYQNGSGSDQSLWAEWELVEALLTQINPLFPDTLFGYSAPTAAKSGQTENSTSDQFFTQNSIEIEQNVISLLQNKNGIDYSNDVEALMYEQNVPSSVSVQQASTSTYGIFQPSRFALVNRMTGQSQPSTQSAEQEQAANSQTTVDQKFMKALMNIICITIEQTDTNMQTYIWLDRLERFVKHLIIVSEVWKSKNAQNYSQVQKRIAEAIAFAFAFLFHEVNNTGTPKSTGQSASQNSFSRETSPQEKVQRTKLFAQSMKNLTIWLANVVHYSDQMALHPAQKSQASATSAFSYFTNGAQNALAGQSATNKDQILAIPASRILLQTIFVKQYQGQNNLECLLSMQDIVYLRESNFEDFPERFHQNEWKVVFFHNKIISEIKRKQLNLRSLEQLESRRKAYSVQVIESISKNEKAKDEILKRIQEETLDTIGSLSEQEFERKNKGALLIDNFIRERHSQQRNHLNLVHGPKGAWRHKQDPTFQQVKLQDTGEGAHCIMVDKPSNAFKLIKDSDVENNIFEKVICKDQANINDRILNQGRVEKMLQLHQESASLSSEHGQQRNGSLVDVNECLEKDYDHTQDVSSDEDSMKNIGANELHRFAEKGQNATTVTDKGLINTLQKNTIEHFSKPLSAIQKKDLKHLYISYLKDQFFLNKVPARKVIIESPCEILKPLDNCKGFMCMTNYELLFFYDMETIEQDSTFKSSIHFFSRKVQETKPYLKVISLSSIKEIQRRHFLTQKTALEIFLTTNKQMLLNFPETEMRDSFAKKILRQRKTKCKNLKYYTSLDPKWILRKKDLTEQWQNWKISNFEYLMQLNQLAGRSYNDLSQYPVMPWLFSNYQTSDLPDLSALQPQPRGGAPPGQFRDLTKNMQLLGSAQRQAEFKRKYDDAESFVGLHDRFHCGSHYSNPGIILHYLSRLAPYVEANVELHGRTLDHPERVFASLDQSFQNALTDFADVRELTPEFYFLPEMFVNHNKCNFGKKQDGTKVNDVMLPAWADQNAFKFVQVMREGIESQYVSNNLHTWIDYIFGCKQRDQEAVMSLNIFSKLTYAPEKEGDFDVSLVSDPNLKAAYESQGYNYGQTPSQLFKQNEAHPPKKPQIEALKSNLVVDIVARLKVFKPVPNQDALKKAKQMARAGSNQVPISMEAIMYAKFVGEQKIVGATKDGFVQHFVWLPRAHDLNPTTPFSLGSDRKTGFSSVEIENGIDQIDRSIKKFDQPILILNEGKHVVRGGYWDGRVVFSQVEANSDKNFELKAHQQAVSAMAVDVKEQVLVTGSKSGEVIVWKNRDFECSIDVLSSQNEGSSENVKPSASSRWFISKYLYDHDRQISSIFISNEMCLFATGSFDGTVCLYNLQSIKLLRTFQHPTLAPIYSVVLAQNPLAICAFFSREDHLWNSFSINGQLLTDLSRLSNQQEKTTNQRVLTEDCSHVISPQVIKDSYHMDKLVYGTEKGYIVLRMLPSMLRFRRLQVSNDFPVLTVLVSPDRRFLHVGCGDGGLIVIQAK